MKVRKVAKDFPIVCAGGLAGGLDAYTRLLRHLPVDTSVAIVIVDQDNQPPGDQMYPAGRPRLVSRRRL